MNYIIGAGGVGSWLTPSLSMLTGARFTKQGPQITVIDGDKLERGNLNRQLFDARQVGEFKSDALAARYGVASVPEWFSEGMMSFFPDDVLLVCVDNHAARKAALETVDREGCTAIFGANETYSAEAYVYRKEWKGTPLDPRIYYPEINTDRSNDPRRAAIGCTGEAQEKTPQLVTANFMAAALMQHLFIVWVFDIHKFTKADQEHLPHLLTSNLAKLSSTKVGVSAQATKEQNAE